VIGDVEKDCILVVPNLVCHMHSFCRRPPLKVVSPFTRLLDSKCIVN